MPLQLLPSDLLNEIQEEQAEEQVEEPVKKFRPPPGAMGMAMPSMFLISLLFVVSWCGNLTLFTISFEQCSTLLKQRKSYAAASIFPKQRKSLRLPRLSEVPPRSAKPCPCLRKPLNLVHILVVRQSHSVLRLTLNFCFLPSQRRSSRISEVSSRRVPNQSNKASWVFKQSHVRLRTFR
mgnify:CR=1 FL=1